jgi:hypothetical protein
MSTGGCSNQSSESLPGEFVSRCPMRYEMRIRILTLNPEPEGADKMVQPARPLRERPLFSVASGFLLVLLSSAACQSFGGVEANAPETPVGDDSSPATDGIEDNAGAAADADGDHDTGVEESCEVIVAHQVLRFREGETEPFVNLLDEDEELAARLIERIRSDETVVGVRAVGASVCAPFGEGQENGRRLNIARGETLARILVERGVPAERVESAWACTYNITASYQELDLIVSRVGVVELTIRRPGPCPGYEPATLRELDPGSEPWRIRSANAPRRRASTATPYPSSSSEEALAVTPPRAASAR